MYSLTQIRRRLYITSQYSMAKELYIYITDPLILSLIIVSLPILTEIMTVITQMDTELTIL